MTTEPLNAITSFTAFTTPLDLRGEKLFGEGSLGEKIKSSGKIIDKRSDAKRSCQLTLPDKWLDDKWVQDYLPSLKGDTVKFMEKMTAIQTAAKELIVRHPQSDYHGLFTTALRTAHKIKSGTDSSFKKSLDDFIADFDPTDTIYKDALEQAIGDLDNAITDRSFPTEVDQDTWKHYDRKGEERTASCFVGSPMYTNCKGTDKTKRDAVAPESVLKSDAANIPAILASCDGRLKYAQTRFRTVTGKPMYNKRSTITFPPVIGASHTKISRGPNMFYNPLAGKSTLAIATLGLHFGKGTTTVFSLELASNTFTVVHQKPYVPEDAYYTTDAIPESVMDDEEESGSGDESKKRTREEFAEMDSDEEFD